MFLKTILYKSYTDIGTILGGRIDKTLINHPTNRTLSGGKKGRQHNLQNSIPV